MNSSALDQSRRRRPTDVDWLVVAYCCSILSMRNRRLDAKYQVTMARAPIAKYRTSARRQSRYLSVEIKSRIGRETSEVRDDATKARFSRNASAKTRKANAKEGR